MLKFWKWSGCSWARSTESLGVQVVGIEEQIAAADKEFILPRYWIDHDDSEKVMTVRVKLPGCKKESVQVRTWNKRQLHVLAASELNRYRLLYNLNYEARFLSEPSFAEGTEVLTCEFRGSTPKCIVCGSGLPRESIAEAKDIFNRMSDEEEITNLDADTLGGGSSLEVVEPRYWITYDGNMALLEADLQGVNSHYQIKFCVANHSITLKAFVGARQYFLELGLEGSTKGGCETNFNKRLGLFSSTIPLLGHYKCNGCMAGRHEASEGASKPKREGNGPYAQYVRKRLIDFDGNNEGLKEEVTRSKDKGETCGSSSFGSGSLILDVADEDVTVHSPSKNLSHSVTTN